MELINVTNKDVGNVNVQTVNARELHSYLEVGKEFSHWIKDRIEMYGFVENEDYVLTIAKVGIRKNVIQKDYHVSLDMAKELSMVDRGEKGKEVRKYFLNCEKSLKESLQRTTALPTNFVEALEMLVVAEKQKIELSNKVKEDKPKVAFFDAVVESELVYELNKAAKILGTGRTRFSNYLKANGYMAKDKTPMQRYIDQGLMDVKFTKYDNGTDVIVSAKPYITGKGLTYFSKKLKGE